MSQTACHVAAVILAAGASSRMGRPKMLLPWGGTSVLGHLLAQWRELGAGQTAVVCAGADQAVLAELDRLKVPPNQRIANSKPEQGMFSSIQCAARWPHWQSELTHWAIVLGDQPHLRRETLRALLDFAAAHPERVCQPGRHGRPRHPVLLPKGLFAQLKDSPAPNLKEFLQPHAARRALREMTDDGLDADLDTPADYQRALERRPNDAAG